MATNYVYWGNLVDAYRWAPGQRAKAGPAYQNAIRLVREEIAANTQDLEVQSNLALYLAKSGDKQGALGQIAQIDRAPKKNASLLLDSAEWRCAFSAEFKRTAESSSEMLFFRSAINLRDLPNAPCLSPLLARYKARLDCTSRSECLPQFLHEPGESHFDMPGRLWLADPAPNGKRRPDCPSKRNW